MKYFVNNAVGQLEIPYTTDVLPHLVKQLINKGYSDSYIESALYAKGFSLSKIAEVIKKLTS